MSMVCLPNVYLEHVNRFLKGCGGRVCDSVYVKTAGRMIGAAVVDPWEMICKTGNKRSTLCMVYIRRVQLFI